jgi:hypothetical protein
MSKTKKQKVQVATPALNPVAPKWCANCKSHSSIVNTLIKTGEKHHTPSHVLCNNDKHMEYVRAKAPIPMPYNKHCKWWKVELV